MAQPARIETHFWLVRSVARSMGLSFSTALTQGALTPDRYAALVADCCEGGCAGACARWLAGRADLAEAPPPFCAIAATLARLRDLSATGAPRAIT